jgi:murein DD-endopeptidase MepM/ murein hydrolase activator NlpD
MRPLAQRLLLLAAGAAILLVAGSTGAQAGAAAAGPTSHGLAIRVTVPDGGGASAASVSAPKDAVAMGGAFAYPADGSVARAGSVTAGAFAVPGSSPSASASSEAQGVVLFNGEITASTVTARVKARAGPKGASGDSAGSQVTGLAISGAGVAAGPGARFNLGDWGYLVTLAQAASPTATGGAKGYTISQTALLVHLNLDHGGLPAGSEIMIGYADASAEAAPAPPPPKPKPKPKPQAVKPAKKPVPPDDRIRPKKQKEPVDADGPGPGQLPPLLPVPQGLDVRLTSGGYVFPVYGPSSFTDTFGASRAATGWHHGEDIFAPLGAPILAVADGTVFSVGWNDVGGLRVWLRDRHGNEFYYAHLSAFSQLAVNGNQVEAGDVLGFMGNTGDAEHTPYHLHFEIHPASLLHKGYDGVVNPYRYLVAWQRLSDVTITGVAGWAAPIAPGASAPRPGAILLHVSDISRASGLEPASLRRAMREAAADSDGSLVGARIQFAALLRRLTGR